MCGRKRDQRGDPWTVFERLVGLVPTSWQEWEKRLVTMGSLRQEVNNGGFDQYFFNSAGGQALDAATAAEAAGEAELAGLIRRAVRLLDVDDLKDRDARQDALEGLDDDAFGGLDDEFFALEESRDLDGAMRSLLP